MNGYEEAGKIDGKINELLENNPISEENGMEWWRFARTVRTGLEIIEQKAKDKVSKQTEQLAAGRSNNKDEYSKVGPTR